MPRRRPLTFAERLRLSGSADRRPRERRVRNASAMQTFGPVLPCDRRVYNIRWRQKERCRPVRSYQASHGVVPRSALGGGSRPRDLKTSTCHLEKRWRVRCKCSVPRPGSPCRPRRDSGIRDLEKSRQEVDGLRRRLRVLLRERHRRERATPTWRCVSASVQGRVRRPVRGRTMRRCTWSRRRSGLRPGR